MRGRPFLWLVLAIISVALAAIFMWPDNRSVSTEMTFAVPVACTIGETCFIQNYVDADPGPAAHDFTCGDLTYDGHKGVDIAVPDLDAMARGVPVLAAAPGTVLRVRDGVPDGFPEDIGDAAVEGTECGNGLVIDHGGGWETQYCHLRQGSLTVEPEQTVAAGDRLGAIGLSGKTEFPHLHISFRRDGQVVDPYVGAAPPGGCGGETAPVWDAAAQDRLAYRASGIVNAGFTAEPPTLRGIDVGEPRRHAVARDSNLIFFVRFFGLRPGDVQHFRLTGPTGEVLAETTTEPAEKHKARWMQYVGRRPPDQGWPAGQYEGTFELERAGDVVLGTARTLDLR